MALSKYDIEVDLANRQGTSHALLVEMVGANKRVLDAGCDTGYLGEALGAFGNQTSGVEINPVTAEEARHKLARVAVGDLENTDLVEVFGRASFDVVVFGDVLEHLRDPLSVLRQARPLLASGGSVLISTPNIAHGDVRLALLNGQFNYTKLGILDETHTRFFTRTSLVDFLHDAGFVLVELRRTKAELFSTEVGVRAEDFDASVVEAVRADPEATTYQFVVRAVPDDATTIASQQALRIDEVEQQLADLTGRVDDLTRANEQLTRANDQLAAEREELARRIDETQRVAASELGRGAQERDRLAAELTAIHQTKVMRATAWARSVYSRLRAL
ncbi:MAG TPA: methyltransferase domain-containing protein [Jatrophihabitantaceae bacterium]